MQHFKKYSKDSPMEIDEVLGKRSILLGYFTSRPGQQSKSSSETLILSSVSDVIDKITHGEISKRILLRRDLKRTDHQIVIVSHFHEKDILLKLFPMLEEMSLVDLGECDVLEEDGINLNFQTIRMNVRRTCSALSQQMSVGVIEIDPCDYPKIAAESAVYGTFCRNEIERNIPRGSYYFDVDANLTPVTIQHLLPKGHSEPLESIAAFKEGLIIGECQNFARLLHGAGFYITLAEFIEKTQEVFVSLQNVKFIYRDEEWIENMGMKSLLQVACINRRCNDQGKYYTCFRQSPCLLEIHYDYCSTACPVVLVGRSTFYHTTDSYFMTEKRQLTGLIQNVSGGASIIATILAVARLKIPVNVIGVVAVGTNSFHWRKPTNMNIATEFDIFSEVPDSHEERLILKDAVSYALSFQPEAVITVATQTNYLTEAFQSFTSVLYSSDDSLAELFLKICSDTGERFIRLPFVDIEDDIFYECVLKKQFCDDCREVLTGSVSPETKSELIDYVSKNWDFAFVTAFCLEDLLKDQKWLHLELNKGLLIERNDDDEIYYLHEITGSPTRSFIYFIQALVKSE